MASLGKSIDLYLMDGTAAGRWQATLSNWNCSSYKIPRGDLKSCDDLPELHAPGVYFLFGRDDESGQQFVYVGEGDDVLKRILQAHTFEKDGSYWTEAVILVTLDGSLDKAKIKYLENRFHSIVIETNRYIVKNGNTPPQSPVQKKVRDMLEEFIMNTQLIMPALGHKVFEPRPSADQDSADEDDLLYFSRNHGKGGQATGKVADDGFWVLKGSYIFPVVADYVPTGVAKARERYADLINNQGILTQDVSFGSPSYASSFVCGKNSNGLTEWKNKDGVTLKELNSDTPTPTKKGPKKSTGNTTSGKPAISEPGEVSPIPSGSTLLHLAGKKAVAQGYVNDEGFVVLRGSQMSPSLRKSCREWVSNHRNELIDSGKVKDYIFIEDVQFSSPSAAAASIVGGEANGLIMWKNEEGKTLKEQQGK
ncbi:MAG: GIY-YIG nuclease family protein [Bacillota bacterium]|jgi:hypothetical protein